MAKMKMKYKVFIIIAIIAVCCGALLISRVQQAAGRLRPAFGAEFLTRPDGYDGLSEYYGFEFLMEPRQMVDGLLYKTLSSEGVDIINGFSTDGRIPAYNLVTLKDDKNFFPPYYAAPLVRRETLEKYPRLEEALNRLAGKISNKKMQELNYQADEKGRKAEDIAREFLTENNFINGENTPAGQKSGTIKVGSKEFTEQEILGEILVQLIEAQTNLEVKKRLNLGGTIICFNALKAGDIDLYPEYTGTGLVNILKEEVVSDPEKVMRIVKQEFREEYDLIWLEPLGFNNTYTLTVRKETAEKLNLETISDLADYINQN